MTSNYMTLNNRQVEIFIPDGASIDEALSRTTHVGVGTHQDDLEILAYDGILKCFATNDKWFLGVTVADGLGTPRDGIYSKMTEDDIRKVRNKEQKKAAFIGEYSAVILLGHSSGTIKGQGGEVVEDIEALFKMITPEFAYTHNPLDRHDTHVALSLRVIEAVRRLAAGRRPKTLFGMEVWRDMDWMNEGDRLVFDVSGHDNIAASLMEVYDSQNCGNKRYDMATIGRRTAHATFLSTLR